jgi:hypothetical protein
MSYAFWGMAVRANEPAVVEALRRWPNEGEARLESRRGNVSEAGWIDVALAPHEGWTVLHLRARLIPSLALHLSRELNTRVISVDEVETIGYEHFSVLDAGSVSRLFTREGDVKERVGVELDDFFQRAKQSPKHRFPPGPLRDATEYLFDDEEVAMEMESEVFRIFNVVVSDINVEAIAADLAEPDFRIWAGDHGDRAMAALTVTGRGEGPWWHELAVGASISR